MVEAQPEKLEYTVSPLKENIGIIFPEGTKENEKKLFAIRLEEARLQGRDIEIDPALKIVPLRPRTEVNPPVAPAPVVPTPVPVPIPVPPVQPQPIATPTPQPVVTPQPVPPVQPSAPVTVQKTETIITANPVNPSQPVTSTQTVQEQKQA